MANKIENPNIATSGRHMSRMVEYYLGNSLSKLVRGALTSLLSSMGKVYKRRGRPCLRAVTLYIRRKSGDEEHEPCAFDRENLRLWKKILKREESTGEITK